MIALVRSSLICDDQGVSDLELHDEVVVWMRSLDDAVTTFRKQRNNERNEVTRARQAAVACACENP